MNKINTKILIKFSHHCKWIHQVRIIHYNQKTKITNQPWYRMFSRCWPSVSRENRRPKSQKIFFFQDKFYSLKAQAHYFTVLIYSANSRAAKLGIFTHFSFTNSPRCSQSINSLIYVFSMHIPSCFLRVLDQSRDRTSSYYRCPKKISLLPLTNPNCFIEKEKQAQVFLWPTYCLLLASQLLQ